MSYFHRIGKSTGSHGGRVLPLLGLLKGHKQNKTNRYVKGSGVGARNIVIRQQKRSRCTSPFKKTKGNIAKDITLSDSVINESSVDELLKTDQFKDFINYETNVNIDMDKYHLDNLLIKKFDNIIDNDVGDQADSFTIYANYNVADNIDGSHYNLKSNAVTPSIDVYYKTIIEIYYDNGDKHVDVETTIYDDLII